MKVPPGLFATRSVQDLVASTEEEGHSLQKSIGPLGLTALGVGAIIGTGIFVLTSVAANKAGIIKDGATLITSAQPPAAQRIIADAVAELDAIA